MCCLADAQRVFAKGGLSKGPAPAWVQEVHLSGQSAIKPENISDGYLFLLKDYQFHVEKQQNYYHFIRKIYSTTGVQKGSQIEVWFDPSFQQVIFHQIKIIRDGKEIEKLDLKKFKLIQQEQSKESYIYDESLSALLILDDVREGDFIEYAYSLLGSNPVFDNKFFTSLYLSGYDPIDKLFINILSPAGRPLHIKSENTTHTAATSTQGAYTSYMWNLENLSGVQPDNDLPYWYNPYPKIWIGEFTTWKQVNDWALKLYTPSIVSGSKVSEVIESIKKAHKSTEARMEAALHVVQNEVRYTGLEAGIGGYKPRNPADVYEQKFGDCKDKALLLCYMLRQLNIQAYPALVNTSSRGQINKWLPSPNAFNHCVAMVELAGKTYWYDPTIADQGGRYDNIYFPDYQSALVIRENTTELTPILLSDLTKTKVIENFMINDMNGSAELSITTQYSGYEADDQRYYFSNNQIKEIEKSYLNYAAKHYAEIEVSKPLITSDNKQTNVFTTYENYTITNFWYAPDSTKPGSLECLTYPQMLRDKIAIPQRPKRTMPVGIAYPIDYEYTVNLILPEHWNVAEDNTEITSAASFFKRNVSYKQDIITIRYFYKTLKNHISAAETPAFIKKQNQILDNLGYMLTYEKSGLTQASAGEDTNWLMVVLTCVFIGVSAGMVYKIYTYDPAPDHLYVKDKPRDIGGWLFLVALGITATPVVELISFLDYGYYSLASWENLTKSTSSGYNPKMALLLVAEMLFNIFSFTYSIMLIVLFFRRRTSFPLLMSASYGFTLLFVSGETYLLYQMGQLDADAIKETSSQLTRLIINGAIWIPYLYVSERSKETFLNTLKVPDGLQEVYKLKM
jgi:transglutaminase-like putative cysteine protease